MEVESDSKFIASPSFLVIRAFSDCFSLFQWVRVPEGRMTRQCFEGFYLIADRLFAPAGMDVEKTTQIFVARSFWMSNVLKQGGVDLLQLSTQNRGAGVFVHEFGVLARRFASRREKFESLKNGENASIITSSKAPHLKRVASNLWRARFLWRYFQKTAKGIGSGAIWELRIPMDSALLLAQIGFPSNCFFHKSGSV